jgi:NADPH:quinone reductase-like Zn-dependent oxidoreductase
MNSDSITHTEAVRRTGDEVILPGRVEAVGLIVQRTSWGHPAPGHVRIRMECTGVSFAEQQMRRGKYYNQPAFPFVPGYDVVGVVDALGDGVDGRVLGQRVAAVTKIGAWAHFVEVDAQDLLPVPASVDSDAAATLIVNGITAWQMLHERAAVRAGGTIVVLGANGGVGSTLVQLARAAGIRAIGVAAPRHHDLVRRLGGEPVTAGAPDLRQQIRALVPDGVDAVFDHVGGPGIRDSWSLLRRGGSLVAYGSASTKDTPGNSQLPIVQLFGRLLVWNAFPNGRRASFYDYWAGRKQHPQRFRTQKADAFAHVLALVATGAVEPQIGGRFTLADIADAMALAESRTVAGKVVVHA